jgi:GNAT superfamily N-acetyltransferase
MPLRLCRMIWVINFPMETKNIKITRVELADIPSMIATRIEYLTEMQGAMSDEYANELKQNLQIYFQQSMLNGSFFALQASIAGKIVSYGAMILKKIPGDFNQSTYLEGDILNMYTLPEYRRRGISSMILEQLIDEAKNLGVSKVALHCSKAGEPLYRKHGFSDPIYPYLEQIIT